MAKRNQVEYMQDVPIFLRKTFEMIDTCNPAIAGWSEDGETFVVKDPASFERTIIPTFFKHSKFTSFVRQLNFYSFRKIKYSDSLRIDPKKEKQTSNYWRFRHENFRRGRPDLLRDIKRMNAQPKATGTGGALQSGPVAPQPVVSAAASKAATAEVQALKKRIDEMHKNIDELTAMVNKVNLKQEEQDKVQEEMQAAASVGAKRKKFDPLAVPMPEMATSHSEPMEEMAMPGVRPDEMVSSMDMDEMPAPIPLPDPMAMASASRESSDSTRISDNEFVDQLFNEFDDDELQAVLNPEPAVVETSNRPDAELMERLGDALALLPKETQEMIVERLIKAIISADFAESSAAHIPVAKVVPTVPVSTEEEQQQPQQPALPLAAATLAALLHHYTTQVQQAAPSNKKSKDLSTKTLPVIPVHA